MAYVDPLETKPDPDPFRRIVVAGYAVIAGGVVLFLWAAREVGLR